MIPITRLLINMMPAGKVLGILGVIIASIIIPQPTWYQALLLYSIIITLFNYKRFSLKGFVVQTIVLGLFLFLIYKLSTLWLWAGMVLIVLVIVIKIALDIRKDSRGESFYMTGLRDIENRLFGRSLDKNWRNRK